MEAAIAIEGPKRSSTTPVPPRDALIGTAIGSFRLNRLLGRGAMGSVYLAENSSIHSRVAVKVLHAALSTDPELVDRFHAEGRAMSVVRHPSVAQVFDAGELPCGRHYLIMELVEGDTLASRIGSPVPAAQAIPWLVQVCEGLEAAHGAGVVHRDLKPENIIITRANQVKLVDFGIAKLMAPGRPQMTAMGLVMGTPAFMAPEQATGQPIDGRTDLYALGLISYALSTGKLPFCGNTVVEWMLAHRDQIPKPPRAVVSSVPKAWSDATMRALEKRPDARFLNAREMRRALLAVIDPKEIAKEEHGAPGVRVFFEGADGKRSSALAYRDLCKGGAFLCTTGQKPAPLSRGRFVFESGGAEWKAPCEVVQHVSSEQAQAWHIQEGFAVQFVDPPEVFRQACAKLIAGKPLASRDGPVDDPQAAEALARWKPRLRNGDPYEVLACAENAPMGEVRRPAKAAHEGLEALQLLPLSPNQRAEVRSALERVAVAAVVLGTPIRRAEHDAQRGNLAGLSRCIAAGLTVSEMEEVRKRFLADHPQAEQRAVLEAVGAKSRLTAGDVPAALACLEAAVKYDPLNIEHHHRYWALLGGRP